MGFPGGSVVKNQPANAGVMGSIPGSGRSPGEGNGNPLQYSCLENPHGQRSPVGYSSRRRKESDMTEQLSTAQHMKSKEEKYTCRVYTHTCTHTPHRDKTAKEMFPPQTQEGKANILAAEKDNPNPKSHICPEKG